MPTKQELWAEERRLRHQIEELQQRLRWVQGQSCLIDIANQERQAEANYRKARKPDWPATLADYWAVREANGGKPLGKE